jgi:hypothetical protein
MTSKPATDITLAEAGTRAAEEAEIVAASTTAVILAALDTIDDDIEFHEVERLRGPALSMLSPEVLRRRLTHLHQRREVLQAQRDRAMDEEGRQKAAAESSERDAPSDSTDHARLDKADALVRAKKYVEARRLLAYMVLGRRSSPGGEARRKALLAALPLAPDARKPDFSPAGKAPSARSQLRVELGRDAVISVTEAAERLPWGDHETQWMVDAGITFKRGRSRYALWGDVLDALPAREIPKKSPRRRTRSRSAGAGGRKVKASDLPRFSRG